MTRDIVVGVDIGGTNSVFGLVTAEGNILYKDHVHTAEFDNPRDLVSTLSNKIKEGLSSLSNKYNLVGVGVGAPNGNFFKGTIEFAPNLRWKGIIPMAEYFSEALNCKALLTNDAKAAALGEMIFGGAKNMKDFLFITLGTGLGSGIVVNGDLVYGHDGFAGELGHVVMYEDGRLCGCGRKGCVETYCSATGIRTTYLELKKTTDPGHMMDAKYIYTKATEGEKEAIEAFNYTGKILGFALANSINYTSPEAIFLFGGLAQAGDFIFKPTKESMESHLMQIYKNKVKILPSLLKENDAAILGAASLIWKHLK